MNHFRNMAMLLVVTLALLLFLIVALQRTTQPSCGASMSGEAYSANIGQLPAQRIGGHGPIGLRNAAIIMQVAKDLGLSSRAQLIGIVTAMQESSLGEDPSSLRPDKNLDAGLFQLRVKLGWHADGHTIDENLRIVNDPVYATRVFFLGHTVARAYKGGAGRAGYHIPGLVNIKGWETMEIGRVTWQVQRYRRGYEYLYRNKVPRAIQIMQALSGVPVSIGTGECAASDGSSVGLNGEWDCPVSPPTAARYGGRDFGAPRSRGRKHLGNDIFGQRGTRIVAAHDGVIDSKLFGNDGGLGGLRVWVTSNQAATYYAHLSGLAPGISRGVRVHRGQLLGYMGNSGLEAVRTPVHLHFQFHPCGKTSSSCAIDPAPIFKAACANPSGTITITGSISGQASDRMLKPVNGRITSPFGYRFHPIYRKKKLHTGMDIAARTGTPIMAAQTGKVIFAGWRGGYGNCTIIDHGNGIATLYGHQSRLAASVGTHVRQGDIIGYVGSTGASTGPHLHWEVRINNTPVDPKPYL